MDDKDVDELQRIWELKEKGAISDQEYLRLKGRILDQPKSAAADIKNEPRTKPGQLYRTNQPTAGNRPDTGPSYKKVAGIGCLVIVGLFIAIAALGGSQNSGPQETVANGKTRNERTDQQENGNKSIAYKAMLKREIASMRTERGPTNIDATKEGVMAAALLIGARAKAYEGESPASLDAETKTLRAEYKRLAVKYQTAAFPRIRAAQAKVLDQLMWEQNIRVAAIGPQNRILRFTGGLFADNAAIAVARDNIADTMTLLRFDQDRYEWYRGSEYTYFKRSSPPDSAFANWDGASWVKIEDPSSAISGAPPGTCVPALAKEVGLKC